MVISASPRLSLVIPDLLVVQTSIDFYLPAFCIVFRIYFRTDIGSAFVFVRLRGCVCECAWWFCCLGALGYVCAELCVRVCLFGNV